MCEIRSGLESGTGERRFSTTQQRHRWDHQSKAKATCIVWRIKPWKEPLLQDVADAKVLVGLRRSLCDVFRFKAELAWRWSQCHRDVSSSRLLPSRQASSHFPVSAGDWLSGSSTRRELSTRKCQVIINPDANHSI